MKPPVLTGGASNIRQAWALAQVVGGNKLHYYFDPEKANYLNLQKSAASVHSLQDHCVFSTKYNRAIFDQQKASALAKLIQEISQENGSQLLGVQIQPNHVHILISLKPSQSLSQVIQKIKGKSSRILRQKYPELKRLPALWTPSNFYRSLGQAATLAKARA